MNPARAKPCFARLVYGDPTLDHVRALSLPGRGGPQHIFAVDGF